MLPVRVMDSRVGQTRSKDKHDDGGEERRSKREAKKRRRTERGNGGRASTPWFACCARLGPQCRLTHPAVAVVMIVLRVCVVSGACASLVHSCPSRPLPPPPPLLPPNPQEEAQDHPLRSHRLVAAPGTSPLSDQVRHVAIGVAGWVG